MRAAADKSSDIESRSNFAMNRDFQNSRSQKVLITNTQTGGTTVI